MDASNNNNNNIQQEVSLKDLLIMIKDWISFFLSKWKWLVLAGILGGGIGLTMAYTKKTLYEASLTFVLEESKSNSLGAYAGIASQFGIDLGGSAGSGIFAGDNIMEFLRSRLMVEKALLAPVTSEGKITSLANLYIDFNKLRKAWGKNPALSQINFPIGQDRSKYTLIQDSVLNVIYQNIVMNNLIVDKIDKKLGFISVKTVSLNEAFSKAFSEQLVKEATDFYISTKTKRSAITVEKLQVKADSVENLLNKKTYSAAASTDLNMNPARSVAMVGTELVTRDKVVLQTMYAEVVKNLEIARMSMAQETPIIQTIDIPRYPLKKVKLGKIKGGLIGGIVGGTLMLFVLFCTRAFKKIMQ